MWSPFQETLPSSLEAAENVRASTSPVTGNQPSILLLDDDPFMLGMHSRMLRGMGYQMIGTAASAEAALTLLRNDARAVDIILCDLNMPGIDGIEFLQILSAGSFQGSVILLSGEGLRIMHTVQKLLGDRLLVLGMLEKPAGRQALRALLDRWVPVTAKSTDRPALAFSSDEVHRANQKRQWLLDYQPQVDLKTGTVTGMEALVRWNHPKLGLVYPDSFIGVVEGCGAIGALTDWVLQEAMEQLARWRAQGLRTGMAVNVSMENLLVPGFANRVGALARETRVSPQNVTLEITESRVMSPSPVPLENLVRLRMQRFGLSIDDFGTGHSSLAQLRDVPFTELKIDRGFVHGALRNQIIRPILEGSIGIAKRMAMQSVAEGVETEEDWHLLRKIGCDLAQGWFVAKPMAPSKVPGWIESWQARRAGLIQGQIEPLPDARSGPDIFVSPLTR